MRSHVPAQRAEESAQARVAATTGASTATGVDFDLHGLVRVRLVDASRDAVAAVAKQLGVPPERGSGDADVVARFVDDLPRSSRLRYLGLDDAGFDDDSFFVLQRDGRRHLRARLALEQLGGRSEIVCERGFRGVPHLLFAVNLAMVAKGVVPVHGSAFVYEGVGVLVAGWAKGGKTEVLLGFMEQGARYVGDEWVYVDRRRDRLYGLHEPIRIWDWHLDDMPRYRATIPAGARRRMSLTRRAASARHRLPRSLRGAGSADVLERALTLVERQSSTRVPPRRLFGADACLPYGPFDALLFVVSHESPAVAVEPFEGGRLAAMMPFSHEFERLELLGRYLQTRFAFPERANTFLEGLRAREAEILAEAFAGKRAHLVRHPFPAPIPALVEAMRPLLLTSAVR